MSDVYEHSQWVVARAKEHGRTDVCRFGDALVGVLAELRGQNAALEREVASLRNLVGRMADQLKRLAEAVVAEKKAAEDYDLVYDGDSGEE